MAIRKRLGGINCIVDSMKDSRGRNRRCDDAQGPDFCWEVHVKRLTEQEFKQRYRLDFDSFMELLRKLARRSLATKRKGTKTV